ncbi:hypothetical protein DYB28_014581 [Aphanomyces astaci]|uniref:Uncharacterized protein n=1 Tax=Aphanomyces astaci TaxID=112090 RepID=A0A397FGJ1_APHAT|nr:hypothetical protein DYB36_010804 [Aphanomyces astaci]RHY23313.1 hypothetical protein DYB25_007277 [Aphanomyces astaci]RHY43191.1 hypothetical protein DYB38_002972 [Aphanomyces astaci]RHY50213.1 hypothetical protein DYB34_010342 [Aphanomyces astaci]RHY76075.1 hypothetical protein DYB30_010923 [Aphanomyces astaci]
MTEAKYTGIFRSVRTIYVEEGLRGMYRGYSAALCSFPVYWSLYFPTYEFVKVQLIVLAAIVSKAIAASFSYPGDVVRTRMQDQMGKSTYKHFLDAMVQIARKEGVGSLYAGFRVNIFRILPQCATTFFVYEHVKASIEAPRDDEPRLPFRRFSTQKPLLQ